MGYTFRTSGPWGPGLSADLTPAQVDQNFWQAIQDIEAKAVQGVGISNFVVSGNQMTVVLTDHTLLGPYPLPMMQLRFRGEWLPNTTYMAGDIFTHAGSTYMVEVSHTSAATFDPWDNDGRGNDYYGLLLSSPASVLPAGGVAGWFLRKATSDDYSVEWSTAALEDLSDILVHAPTNGQVLTYEGGIWSNTNSTASTLASLEDVSLTTPVAGQPLVYNGTDWVDASVVDMPCGGLNAATGSITINRSVGEVQRFSLTGTVTLTSITGWPPGGQFARLVIEMQNTGSFGFAWPTNVKWPGGVVPAVTANGKDLYILVSFDGGLTVYGNCVGQDFR